MCLAHAPFRNGGYSVRAMRRDLLHKFVWEIPAERAFQKFRCELNKSGTCIAHQHAQLLRWLSSAVSKTLMLSSAQGYTPLHIASLHGQLDIVLLLLQKGAAIDASTDLMHTPLHFACQYNHDKVRVCCVVSPLRCF